MTETKCKCIYQTVTCSPERLCLGCWSEHMTEKFPNPERAWND